MKTKLKDEAVVLTGGSRGIGRETAIRLDKEGARLAIISRNETRLAKTAADVRQQGAEIFSLYPPWNDRINRLFLPSEYK
ncbi:MAG: SDR family NAD(P)-dependent oxidoreductase [Proteobacteria bacterium]|nr:SDR family NAD(P)-dependent oxidoreductase [Pseudomonadota bacterium]